ncbi:MAG: SgcJ/EcaC family oxidoreductase [Chitinophagaceae bacterium]|nr:SgcJ/EcaC family oxidoreductase [Chitinophagaceae bacterium]
MKKTFATIVLLLVSTMIFAQDTAKDKSAINAQVNAMMYSWNNHNYDDLKNYTTENTDWVNAVGMWWKGRKESQYAHQVYHNTIMKESVGDVKSVAIRFLTKDVAIVHTVLHYNDENCTLPNGEKGTIDDTIATLVFVKRNGKWLMEAGENTVIVPELQQYDPVKQMPKN